MIIGIGEYAVSNNKVGKIKTFALASCVAVTAYSPVKKIGGMIHIALPAPTGIDNNHGPGYYATIGVPLLINRLCQDFGCLKGELKVQVYGGANSINQKDMFNIGESNIKTVLKVLSSLNLKVHHMDVGGTQSRTIELNIGDGSVKVSYHSIGI